VAYVGDDQACMAGVRAALAREGVQGILVTRHATEAAAQHPAVPLAVFLGLLESPVAGSCLPAPG
jgi:hypothetical protein